LLLSEGFDTITPQNYMKNVMTGQVAAVTATPSLYRRELLDLLAASPVITTEEYETATARILACQNLATLQKWYRNCIREIARREELEPETAPITYATAEQKQEVIRLANSQYITRAEKCQALLRFNQCDYAQAVSLIGNLWAKMLHRQERAAEGVDTSFSDAA
jgi:hypothetical protein